MLSAKDLHKFFNTRQGNQGEKNISCRENQNGSGVALYQTKISG